MRDSGFISFQSGLIILLAVVMSGCTNKPHNDVLLFGTNTKFALDISAPPENAGVPQLTVGYKRQEFVWMPLYVNAKVSTYVPTGANLTDGKYIGEEGDKDKDTYSVLASFGADFGAGTGEASGGLAQMFATGIAARKLAERDSIVKMFSVQPEGAGVDAAKVKEMLEKFRNDAIKDKKTLAEFLKDSSGNVDVAKLKQILKDTGRDDAWADSWAGKPVKEFTDWLDERDSAISRRLVLNLEAVQS